MASEAWLVKTLGESLSLDPGIQKAAEGALAQADAQTGTSLFETDWEDRLLSAGYGLALARTTLSSTLDPGVRQLAGVLLKQYVNKHWQEEEESFTPPPVSDHEKAEIRAVLVTGLGDADPKIRTAVGMAVASIASSDWPHDWPHLMPTILTALDNKIDKNATAGAVRCLALFADDIEDRQLAALAPPLFPALYAIVANSEDYDLRVRRCALVVVRSCLETLGMMSGVYKKEVTALVGPMLPNWCQLFGTILAQPIPSEHPMEWGLRLEVLRVLSPILQHLAPIADTHLPALLAPLWQSWVGGIPVYQRSCVEGKEDCFSGAADEDGYEQSLETLALQTFEILLTLAVDKRLRHHCTDNLEALLYFSIAYMQMTAEQVCTWSSDPNSFVSDEEEGDCSCRTSVCLLIEELVEQVGSPVLCQLAVVVQRRMQEAGTQADTWQMREAALLALGTASDALLHTQDPSVLHLFQAHLWVASVVQPLMGPDSDSLPFLRTRALWTVANFSSGLQRDQRAYFLQLSCDALRVSSSGVVVAGACRAITQLCRRMEDGQLHPFFPPLYSCIGDQLGLVSEDLLHLVLNTLGEVIDADSSLTPAMADAISPPVLAIWATSVSDPVVSSDAADVLVSIAHHPLCLQGLLRRALPILNNIVTKPEEGGDVLVAAALDLTTLLLMYCPKEVVVEMLPHLLPPLLSLLLVSEDHSCLQNGTQCITAMVRKGGEEVVVGDRAVVVEQLLKVAARLLHPDLEASASLFVGGYITALLLHLPSHLSPHLPLLLPHLVHRLATCKMPTLRSSLLLVFAHLVHSAQPNIGNLIDRMGEEELQVLMGEWCNYAGEVVSEVGMKQSTTALALLLQSRHPRLAHLAVQGQPRNVNHEGIMTRSRTKASGPPQWTTLSFPAKALHLVAEALLQCKQQEGRGEGGGWGREWWAVSHPSPLQEGEWEEVTGEEGESDEEGDGEGVLKDSALFSHLLIEGEDGSEGGEEEEAANDPMNRVDLPRYLTHVIRQLALDEAYFHSLLKELSPREHSDILAAMKQT